MAALLVLVLVAAVLFGITPRSTRLLSSELQIRSSFHASRIPLADIVRAEPFQLQPWTTFRLFAIGWPFPPSGWLWSREYGRFRALASSRRNLYLLTLRDRSRLLVSLPGPVELPSREKTPSIA